MKIGLYPGNFDPITNGHLDIINRSLKIVDKLLIAVYDNINRDYLFDLDIRTKLVMECVKDNRNIEVITFVGLINDCAKENEIDIIIRGLRTIEEYEEEKRIHGINVKLNSSIETVYLMANEKNAFLNSSIVREILLFGGEASKFIPEAVATNINLLE